jgi:hypothetical protein
LMAVDVRVSSFEIANTVRLAHDVGVQRNGHDLHALRALV